MREFGAGESQNNFLKLLDLVERGEEIVITRHGKPVARLSPHSALRDKRVDSARAAAARIRARASTRKTGPFDWEEWKRYRDEGRK